MQRLQIKIYFLIFIFLNGSHLLAQQFSDFQFQPNSYKIIAEVDSGHFAKAEQLLDLIDTISVFKNNVLQAEYNFVLGYYKIFSTAAGESFDCFTNAGAMYDQLNMNKHRNLCEAFIAIDMYVKTRWAEFRIKGEEVLRNIPLEEEETRAFLQNYIGAEYAGSEMVFSKAEIHTNSSIRYFKKHNNNRRLISLYGIKTACQTQLGNYDAALTYVDSAQYFAELMDNQAELAFLNIRRHLILFEQKKYREAFAYLKDAEDYFSTHTADAGNLEWVYGIARRNYAKLKNYEKAYEYYLKGVDLDSETRMEKNDKQINELLIEYETEKKERQLEIQALNLKLGEQKIQNITFGGLGLLGILTLGFLIFYNQYKNRQQKIIQEKELSHQQSLLETTINTQESERKRIARDLHDGIGQQLSGLKMGLEQYNRNQESQNGLIQQIEQLKLAAQEVRSLSHQMMPKALQTLGLSAAISDMLEKSFHGTAIRYNFEQLGKEKRLDENIEIGCYRILQELINNIIKHSQATEIEVQLILRGENLILILEENGRGFDPNNNEKMGHGLSNMMLRAKILNGSIEFAPQEIGMLTTLKIPLTSTPHVQSN